MGDHRPCWRKGDGADVLKVQHTHGQLFKLLAHPEDLENVKSELAAAVPDKNKVPS